MDPGFAVLDRCGIDPEDAVGREGWTTIKCASKRAYGCGRGGNRAVQDLDLLLHHGDLQDLSSCLCVRAGDKVFRWIDEVMDAKGGMSAVPGDRYFSSMVEIVDKGLIVVTVCFAEYGGFDYYLVFDAVDSSLSMVPYIPGWATYTARPLPLRHDDDAGYSLFHFGSEFGVGREGADRFLWRWSPLVDGGSSSSPWQTRKLRFPAEMKDQFFTPDVLFSSNDLAFWTDLSLGTLCCDRSTLLGAGYLVNFTFIELPPGYQVDRDEDTWSVVYRTIGWVGGSLKFVSIDNPDPCDHGRGPRVKVWTLAPSGRDWKLYSNFRLKNLWKDFKGAGLPNNLPMWPMLREEQQGSALYLILAEDTQTRDGGHKHYICRLDMPTKSLLQSKLLAHTSLIQGPVMLPSGFFQYLDPLPSSPDPILMQV